MRLMFACPQKLLGIDSSEVEACLTCMVTVTRGEYVKRNYNRQQAEGKITQYNWDRIEDGDADEWM